MTPTTQRRCTAKLEQEPHLRCPHPGVEKREGRSLCGNHLRVYDALGGAPEHWRTVTAPPSVTVSSPPPLAPVVLAEEPESNAFLDDTPPPVWVDPAHGFDYPEATTQSGDLISYELDEPAVGVWWFLLGVVAVLAAMALGFWWGRATADTNSGKAIMRSTPAVQSYGAIPADQLYGTDAATQFYANQSAPSPAQIETFEAALRTAAADVGVEDLDDSEAMGASAPTLSGGGGGGVSLPLPPPPNPQPQREVEPRVVTITPQVVGGQLVWAVVE